jgi:hypothetical protein
MKNLILIVVISFVSTFFASADAQVVLRKTTLSELTGENVSLYNALAKFYNRNLTNKLYTMQDFRNDAVKFSTLTENLKYYYAANNGANNLAILHAPLYVNQGDVVLDYKQADALFNSKNELNTNEEVNIASAEVKNDVKEDIKEDTADYIIMPEFIVDNNNMVKEIIIRGIDKAVETYLQNENGPKISVFKNSDLSFSYNSCKCDQMNLDELLRVDKTLSNIENYIQKTKSEFKDSYDRQDFIKCRQKVKSLLGQISYVNPKKE